MSPRAAVGTATSLLVAWLRPLVVAARPDSHQQGVSMLSISSADSGIASSECGRSCQFVCKDKKSTCVCGTAASADSCCHEALASEDDCRAYARDAEDQRCDTRSCSCKRTPLGHFNLKVGCSETGRVCSMCEPTGAAGDGPGMRLNASESLATPMLQSPSRLNAPPQSYATPVRLASASTPQVDVLHDGQLETFQKKREALRVDVSKSAKELNRAERDLEVARAAEQEALRKKKDAQERVTVLTGEHGEAKQGVVEALRKVATQEEKTAKVGDLERNVSMKIAQVLTGSGAPPPPPPLPRRMHSEVGAPLRMQASTGSASGGVSDNSGGDGPITKADILDLAAQVMQTSGEENDRHFKNEDFDVQAQRNCLGEWADVSQKDLHECIQKCYPDHPNCNANCNRQHDFYRLSLEPFPSNMKCDAPNFVSRSDRYFYAVPRAQFEANYDRVESTDKDKACEGLVRYVEKPPGSVLIRPTQELVDAGVSIEVPLEYQDATKHNSAQLTDFGYMEKCLGVKECAVTKDTVIVLGISYGGAYLIFNSSAPGFAQQFTSCSDVRVAPGAVQGDTKVVFGSGPSEKDMRYALGIVRASSNSEARSAPQVTNSEASSTQLPKKAAGWFSGSVVAPMRSPPADSDSTGRNEELAVKGLLVQPEPSRDAVPTVSGSTEQVLVHRHPGVTDESGGKVSGAVEAGKWFHGAVHATLVSDVGDETGTNLENQEGDLANEGEPDEDDFLTQIVGKTCMERWPKAAGHKCKEVADWEKCSADHSCCKEFQTLLECLDEGTAPELHCSAWYLGILVATYRPAQPSGDSHATLAGKDRQEDALTHYTAWTKACSIENPPEEEVQKRALDIAMKECEAQEDDHADCNELQEHHAEVNGEATESIAGVARDDMTDGDGELAVD